MSRSSKDQFLALFAAIGFALAQPVFDLFEKTPEYFVIQRTGKPEIFLFAATLLLIIPAVFFLIEELLSRLHKGLGWIFHLLIIAAAATSIFLPNLIKAVSSSNENFYLVYCAIALGVVAAAIYHLSASLRSFLRVLSAGPLLFALYFYYTIHIQTSSSSYEQNVAAQVPGKKPVPTFLVIFDEFPAIALMEPDLTINEKRFPNFARLASLGTWYRNGSSVCSWTERAVPVILTGQLPDPSKKQVPSLKDYPQNLYTLFSQSHVIKGFEQVTHLCPDNLCQEDYNSESLLEKTRTLIEDAGVVYLHYILPESAKGWLPSISSEWGGFLKAQRETAKKKKKKSKKGLLDKGEWGDDDYFYEKFIESIKGEARQIAATDKAPLYTVHITFPHVPYRYLPDGRKYLENLDSRNDKGYKKSWKKDDLWPSTIAMQRFLLQTGYADVMIGQLLDALTEAQMLDESMIVVTADHGVSFQPGEFSRRVSNNNYMEVLSVPYFIKKPGQTAGEISDKNVETIDILPTMLDINGLTPPHPLDGVSAVASGTTEKDHKTFLPIDSAQSRLTYSRALPFEPMLSRINNTFGSGGFDDRFFSGVPSHPEIIGQETVPSALIDTSYRVKIQNLGEYQNVEVDGDFVPAMLLGNVYPVGKGVSIPHDSKFTVAISVNNVIRAVTQTEGAQKGFARFQGMISPNYLNKGQNSVAAVVLKSAP